MALEPGTHFGSYVVAESVGSGGMGEVYRATDTELKRDVALKVLPQAFVDDADRLARFQREAEILASLNHPNIAQIHGLERSDGLTAIVMELVDGLTLADRIKEGPIPPDEAMGIALQIVAALEAAHGNGIVHRDLKPANVKVKEDGTVKVLDFGISKPIDASAISGGSPVAATPAVTETGVILGTAAYMSPEQAKGKVVDERTDIWAFGCLLFEMLTGQPAFAGEDVMAILARVLERDTDLTSMPGTISPAVRHTIRLCLEKDPRKRIADIRDVRLAIEGQFESEFAQASDSAVRPSFSRVSSLAVAAVLAAVIGVAVWFLKPEPQIEPGLVARSTYALPDGIALGSDLYGSIDIAATGESYVFLGSDGIHHRQIREFDSQVVAPNSDDFSISSLTISPNGTDFAYFRRERIDFSRPGEGQMANRTTALVRRSAEGGGETVLHSYQGAGNIGKLRWEDNGTILISAGDAILWVPDSGGEPQTLVEAREDEEISGGQLLPGDEWVLYSVRKRGDDSWSQADIVMESRVTHERHTLRPGGFAARYLPSGYLTYLSNDQLYASIFDPVTLELSDQRINMVQGVRSSLAGAGLYAVSDDGHLVYVLGGAPAPSLFRPPGGARTLSWVSRNGEAELIPGIDPNDYVMARISSDGKKVALVAGTYVEMLAQGQPASDIFIYDFETENMTQLTEHPATDYCPVWSLNGEWIYFTSHRDDAIGIYRKSTDSRIDAVDFIAPMPAGHLSPCGWSISPDGSTILGNSAETALDVLLTMLPVSESEEITPLMDDDGMLTEPSLSPNGEWLLYHRTESGDTRGQINIRPFPEVSGSRTLVGPGQHPVFSANGTELFFFNNMGIWSAPVEYEPFRVGDPTALFESGDYWYAVAGGGLFGRAWDVDPLNDRFLMINMPEGADAAVGRRAPEGEAQINVVLNWVTELDQRVRMD